MRRGGQGAKGEGEVLVIMEIMTGISTTITVLDWLLYSAWRYSDSNYIELSLVPDIKTPLTIFQSRSVHN